MNSSVPQNINIGDISSNTDKEIYLRRWLEDCSRSKKEIDIIFNHFLNGWMLSEIIAPSEAAMQVNDEHLISKSIQALEELDRIIAKEKETNKDFRNAIMANLVSKINPDN